VKPLANRQAAARSVGTPKFVVCGPIEHELLVREFETNSLGEEQGEKMRDSLHADAGLGLGDPRGAELVPVLVQTLEPALVTTALGEALTLDKELDASLSACSLTCRS
jgi:hypothetical protein